MSRRQVFVGLVDVSFCLSVLLLYHAGGWAQASHGSELGEEFRARGRICLDVDLQGEFERTVRAVRGVLDLSDRHHQQRVNRTIYKGLLNHVIGQAIHYPAQIRGELPEADERAVQELEEAGFVALASLAKGDYFADVDAVSLAEPVPKGSVGQDPDADRHLKNGGPSLVSTQANYSPHVEDNKHSGTPLADSCQTSTCAQSGNYHQATQTNLHLRKPSHSGTSPAGSGLLQSSLSNDPTVHATPHKDPVLSKSESVFNSPPSDAPSLEFSKPKREGGSRKHRQSPTTHWDSLGRLVSMEGVPVIEDDLYWSAEIDTATPKGFSQRELDEWKDRISKQTVRSFEPGGLEKCGREKNRFIVLEDGSKLCARYRYPLLTSMTGELYSYHLARMLGLTNLPPLHLSVAATNSSFWRGQGSNFQDAGWQDGKVVMLTKWIEGLEKAFLPETLVQGPLSAGALENGWRNLTIGELSSLVQWSDLLVFDYLIAHFDRLTINLSGVKHYNDSAIMRSEVHNLVQHPHTKQLWIVDNESGLLDGYSFLLSEGNPNRLLQGELHEQLLEMTCVFRRSTAEAVRSLLAQPDPARLLTARVLEQDPVSRGLFPELDRIPRHAAVLRERLERLQGWFEECRQRNVAARENSSF
ncbi:uncharacterized protein LOC110975090 [Acanthaster planci]|uniref:Uncharacterized protein LOC110975090 n=1 Tax=Acanthaster planci TaxID=133434 RepID=A0A8B7XSF8_ACAPL|nr:uncharacterized protein LOC110975090 [Acanthaster planci]